MRGVEDRHQKLPLGSDRDVPVVSYDLCYTGVSEGESKEKLTILVSHDTGTGSMFAFPLPSKHQVELKHAAVEIIRFVQSLGHATIKLECDNEPSTLVLQNMIVSLRNKLGLKTLVRDAPIESHASNGRAEKCVDLLRGLSNVLLDYVRTHYGVEVGPEHPLMAWSYIHASFLLDRFGVRDGATPHERSHGARYSGRLAVFGEPVWGFLKGKAKGDRKWRRGLFLTKSTNNDMYVLMNEQGVWLTRSIRRTDKPWKDEQQLVKDGKVSLGPTS